jgi:hypothetical protein
VFLKCLPLGVQHCRCRHGQQVLLVLIVVPGQICLSRTLEYPVLRRLAWSSKRSLYANEQLVKYFNFKIHCVYKQWIRQTFLQITLLWQMNNSDPDLKCDDEQQSGSKCVPIIHGQFMGAVWVIRWIPHCSIVTQRHAGVIYVPSWTHSLLVERSVEDG